MHVYIIYIDKYILFCSFQYPLGIQLKSEIDMEVMTDILTKLQKWITSFLCDLAIVIIVIIIYLWYCIYFPTFMTLPAHCF